MTEDMIVYEKLSSNPIKFESTDEFMRYYYKNKDMIDNMKTRGMNRKFIIDGYKIGRKEGKIILYPNQQIIQPIEEKEDDIIELKLDSIVERIKKLEQQMNQFFNLLRSTLQEI